MPVGDRCKSWDPQPAEASHEGLTLVTGATGLLGIHLVALLQKRGYRVRILVRATWQSKLFPTDIEVVTGDIRNSEDVNTAVSGCRFVFHCCSTHVYNVPAEEMWAVNVEGTRNICDAVERHGCERLVFTSTVSALKARAKAVKPEAKMPARQRNSVNKQLADELVMSRVEHGLPAVIVSPSYFVGPLDHSPSPIRLWVPLAIVRPVGLVPSGGFNIVGAADVARAHIWALEEGKPGQHYPIAGENLSLLEYVTMVNRAVGSNRVPRLISPGLLRALGRGRVFDGYVAAMLSRQNPVDIRYDYPFPIQPVEEVISETVDWFKSSSPLVKFGALLHYACRRYL